MRRESRLVRLLRMLSGKSQEVVAEALGVHPSLIGHFERGRAVPSREHLERLAKEAGITLLDAEEVLRLYDAFRKAHRSGSRGATELLDGLAEEVRVHTEAVVQRILTMTLPNIPLPEDRERGDELWRRLEGLSSETWFTLVHLAEEFQHWALCEKVCAESAKEALRDIGKAAVLVRLAQDIADRVPGPELWRNRIRGYAIAHAANVMRVAGDLTSAATGFQSARILWNAGADPDALLDGSRLTEMETALYKDRRVLEGQPGTWRH